MLWDPAKRSFDLVFMDVYQTMLGDDVLSDIKLFNKKGSFEEYRFWGQEKVLLDAWKAQEHPKLSFLEKAYFMKWQETEDTSDPNNTYLLPEMYESTTDPAFRAAVLEALGIDG